MKPWVWYCHTCLRMVPSREIRWNLHIFQHYDHLRDRWCPAEQLERMEVR